MQGIVGDHQIEARCGEFKVLDRRHHASHGVEALLSGLGLHPADHRLAHVNAEDVGAFPRQGQCQSAAPAPEVDTVRAAAHLRRLDRHGCHLGHPHVVVPVPGIRPGLPFAPLRMDGQVAAQLLGARTLGRHSDFRRGSGSAAQIRLERPQVTSHGRPFGNLAGW